MVPFEAACDGDGNHDAAASNRHLLAAATFEDARCAVCRGRGMDRRRAVVVGDADDDGDIDDDAGDVAADDDVDMLLALAAVSQYRAVELSHVGTADSDEDNCGIVVVLSSSSLLLLLLFLFLVVVDIGDSYSFVRAYPARVWQFCRSRMILRRRRRRRRRWTCFDFVDFKKLAGWFYSKTFDWNIPK